MIALLRHYMLPHSHKIKLYKCILLVTICLVLLLLTGFNFRNIQTVAVAPRAIRLDDTAYTIKAPGTDTLKEVNTDTIKAVDTDTIKAVNTRTKKAVNSDTTKAVNSDTIMAVNSDTIKAVNTDTIMAVNSDTIKAVNSDTIKAVNTDTIKAVNTDTIKAVNTDMIKAVDSDTINTMGTDTIKSVNTDTLKAVDTNTIQEVDTGMIKTMNLDTIKTMDTDTIKAVNTDTINTVNSDTIKAINSDTIKALNTDTTKTVYTGTIKAVDTDTIKAVKSDTIKTMNTDTIKAVETDTAANMRPLNVSSASSTLSDIYAMSLRLHSHTRNAATESKHTINAPVATVRPQNVTTSPFLKKLVAYNDAISNLRHDILRKRGLGVNYWKPIFEPIQVLWGNRDDFVQRVANWSHIITIRMPWTSRHNVNATHIKYKKLKHANNISYTLLTGDRDNMLVQDYYRWTATEPLCTWIRTKAGTKARWDAVYSRTCDDDISNASGHSRGLEVVYMYGKPINVRDYWPNNGDSYPDYFYTSPPLQVLYCHIVEDVVITSLGDIISGSLKLVPYACSQDTTATMPHGYQRTPIYTEVFVITQFWGAEFFHKMTEGLPRLAPYISFLKQHTNVKIHAAELGGYTAASLEFLGIHPERLISGLCRAKVVYLPQATPCGFAQLQSTQLLSMHYRHAIHQRSGPPHRNSIVLVERSGTRRFTHARSIRDTVQSVANRHGLSLEIFSDRPVSSMTTAMLMFNRAVIVVAPHGGGLSNIIYSEPGTFVVEGVCNRPHVNMCYQWLAHVLGHRYHAVPSRGGCEDVVDIDDQLIADIVRVYAKQIVLARRDA